MNKEVKVCQNCGEIFDGYNTQKYCSHECRRQGRLKTKNNYYERIYRGNDIDEYLNDDIYISENKRMLPPEKEDIADVLMLLDDFDIEIEHIPEFNTYAELCDWKNANISNRLC